MADPRDAISLVGIRPLRVTLTIDNSSITASATAAGGSAQVGRAVGLSADNTVELLQANNPLLGKLISVNVADSDLRCTVQVGGFMELPKGDNYAGSPGDRLLGDTLSAADGYVKEVGAVGTAFAQAELQAILDGRGIVYDDSDANNVVAHLPG